MKQCLNCPFSTSKCQIYGENINILDESNVQIDLMIIGEAPGKIEEIQHRPFVGRSGQLVRKVLSETKLFRKKIFITNTLECRPINNATPTLDQMKICLNKLEDKILKYKPRVILCLGKSPSLLFNTNLTSFSKIVMKSTFFFLNKDNFPYSLFSDKLFTEMHNKNSLVVFNFHPAYILRNNTFYSKFYDNFNIIANYLLCD